MLTLLWGLLNEAPMISVAEALRQAGADTVFLDQRDVLKSKVCLEVGKQVAGRVSSPEGEFDLQDVRAAYIRPYDSRVLSSSVRPARARSAKARATAVDETLLSWCDVAPGLVLNRPSSAATNNSKPYQYQFIHSAGFKVAETLITTAPEAVAEFRQRHGRVIYKSVSGIRSRVSELTAAHLERLPNVTFCPTQFQKMISGRDHRVHVVGDEVFACELICNAEDYRYPGEHPLEIRPAYLPPLIEEHCVLLARSLELPLAGIDLRQTVDDEWYCFEVNPSPAFTFYQESTGQPIAAAIADLLMKQTPLAEVHTLPIVGKKRELDEDIPSETLDYA
jgi:hypothetical protein